MNSSVAKHNLFILLNAQCEMTFNLKIFIWFTDVTDVLIIVKSRQTVKSNEVSYRNRLEVHSNVNCEYKVGK